MLPRPSPTGQAWPPAGTTSESRGGQACQSGYSVSLPSNVSITRSPTARVAASPGEGTAHARARCPNVGDDGRAAGARRSNRRRHPNCPATGPTPLAEIAVCLIGSGELRIVDGPPASRAHRELEPAFFAGAFHIGVAQLRAEVPVGQRASVGFELGR